jgi:predicted AlkP superfamily phosphohydrolase/phosphomutase
MTGKRPGRHGVFHFINLFNDDRIADGKPPIVNARSLKSSTLWDVIGHHGRKVALINVPMTYPPRPVNGLMISCFLTPRNASVFTYPPELSTELKDYVIDLDRFIDAKPYRGQRHDEESIAPTLSLMEEFRDMTEKRAKTTLTLMEKAWDFFMVVFTSTDRMGHYLWPYHRSAEANDSSEVKRLCQAVCQHYIRLDEIVGELVQKAGDGVTVIVMSDHGMGSGHTKRFHCNQWLNQKGWLSAKANSDRKTITNPDYWLRRLGLPRDKIGQILRRLPGLGQRRLVEIAAKSHSLVVDKTRSKAYCVPIFDNVTGIRITLPSVEKEAKRDELIGELNKVVDPETGQTVVEQIFRGEDYYHGPYAQNIPDIIVCLKPNYGCGYQLGNYSSVVTKMQEIQNRGNHRFEGLFIANGPKVASNPELLLGLNIEDIAPTVLYLMGLPVPSDMDGRVLTETLVPAFAEPRAIEYTGPIGFWPDADEVVFSDEALREEDEAVIRSRLQALGYLG